MTAQPASAADFTLDELRLELAPAIADAAAFDGWSEAVIDYIRQAEAQ